VFDSRRGHQFYPQLEEWIGRADGYRKIKRMFVVTLALLLFGGSPWAQPVPTQSSIRIAPGTVVSAELVKSVDVKKAKPGDKVEAKTVGPLVSNGQVVASKGAKIIGHIAMATPRSRDSKGATLGIVFDTLSTRAGEVIIQVAIQAIGPVEPVENYLGVRPGVKMEGNPEPPPSGVAGQPADNSGMSLDTRSQGIIGLKDLSLNRSGQVSVVTSSHENIRLEGGTQLILRIEESL
jgi:hypothetical protein